MARFNRIKSVVLGASLLALSCGGTKADATAPAVSVQPAKPAPSQPLEKVEEHIEAPEPAAPVAPTEKEEPAPKVPSTVDRVTALCEEHCKKVEGACKATTADTCRANCESYVIQAERCPVEVERALACRRDAQEQVLCSVMVAAGCEPAFATLKECSAGKRPPISPDAVPETTPSGSKLVGFASFESSVLGVSVLLPTNAVESASGEEAKVRGEDAGIEYFAENLPAAIDKPTDRSILKAAIAYLGQACQPKLKLHGRFDKEGSTFVRFDTTCKDTTEWHGMFVVHHGKTIAIAARKKPGVTASFVDLEEFLFSARVRP